MVICRSACGGGGLLGVATGLRVGGVVGVDAGPGRDVCVGGKYTDTRVGVGDGDACVGCCVGTATGCVAVDVALGTRVG